MSLIHQAPVVVQGRRPGLYLGGKADAKDRDKLERYNVTHILNMTTSKEVNIKVSWRNGTVLSYDDHLLRTQLTLMMLFVARDCCRLGFLISSNPPDALCTSASPYWTRLPVYPIWRSGRTKLWASSPKDCITEACSFIANVAFLDRPPRYCSIS
jgi:hypothetical protein